MEMSFTELKILNVVGADRPSVGRFFHAVPKIEIRSVVPPLCWFLWLRNMALSIKYGIPTHCVRVYQAVVLPWPRQSGDRWARKN